MCNASRLSRSWESAKAGSTLVIGTLHGLGAFHRPHQAVADCVICVENGAEIQLTGIPATLQAKLGIGAIEMVEFVDDNEGVELSMHHDLFLFVSHPELGAVPVAHFANQGIRALVHTVAGRDDAVERIKQMALPRVHVGNTPTIEAIARRRIVEYAR
jgi:hypothetical protein